MKVILDIKNIDLIKDVLKVFLIGFCVFYTAVKIDNKSKNNKNMLIIQLIIIGITVLCTILKEFFQVFNNTISLTILLIIAYYIYTGNKIGYSILLIIISSSINYILFFCATAISFIPNKILNIDNKFVCFGIITIIYFIALIGVLKLKKLRNGLSFLKSKMNNEYMELLVLNISAIILFSIILITKGNSALAKTLLFAFIIFSSIMFITIQKSIQLYYKQKLLVQELKETKDKLEEKTKEIKELEEENIKISKKSHTLVHKQKSLEHKIEGLIGKTEISKEEVGELTNRIKEINKELYKEKTVIELDKTEIPQIDDMLKYMQSECKKNNIDFELQIKGNIYHMTNNLISKEDLETLLADHIKNAIIAINHGNNINRSILVRIGKIDECYGLYIYDSGIEFEKETLKNLGKKPSTTHVNEGGTGMGFMNTFDTLKKCNASLIIEEYNEPSKDNYTKVIKIKFNNKNEFEIKTYR